MTVRALLVIAGLLLTSSSVRAQVFSPGPLSKAHAELEGMGSCKRCHGDGSQHDNSRCVECHTEIGRRQAARSGYHGRLGAQLCAECHREHRGAAAKIVEWPAGQRAFNHGLTTWPLVGRHKKTDCRDCHDARRLEDKDAIALQQKGRDTFLGLPTGCADCHFDEHRSREHGNRPGSDCQKCHTPDGFKPTPRFDHNNKGMAQFALTGRHKRVDCQKCHTPVVDDTTAATAFPAPKAREYLQLNDIPHTSCVDCHDDPHRGNFGRSCTRCHTTAGWTQILQTAEDTGFHDKTKFPLRGGHTSVACKTCHGPFPGQRAVFKGLKHERCSDCHMDAHVGQLAASKSVDDPQRCDRCHSVTGFSPSSFNEAAHEKTRQPLQGAHRAVACGACHTSDPGLARKVPSAVRASLTRQKRALVTADVRLMLPQLKTFATDAGASIRCDGCHKDPHGGQFSSTRATEKTAGLDTRIAERSCAACHVTSSFRRVVVDPADPDSTAGSFRHDDTAFPLVGKHQQVPCSRCHSADTAQARGRRKEAAVVRYRGVSTRCVDCHTDEHVGQLAKDGVTDCARCHQPTGFKPSTFNHLDAQQTRFVLQGRHKDVPCVKCHVATRIPAVDDEGETTARYRPLPMDCAACHEDEHDGQRFERFVP